jgi:hypothetical protein
LAHTQTIQPISDDLMVLRTTLLHESGESITSDLPLPIRQEGGRGNAMQALGSTLTYARRYGLLAIYGLAGDDDDGETAAPAPKKAPAPAATAKPKPATPAQPTAAPAPTAEQPQEPPAVVFAPDAEVAAIKVAIKNHPNAKAIIEAFKTFKGLPEKATQVSTHIQFPADLDFLNAQLTA